VKPAFVAFPRGPRYAAIGFSAVLVVGAVIAFTALGPEVRARFTGEQIFTLVLFLVVMVTIMGALGFSSVRVQPDGLWYRNGLRSHVLPWSDVGEIQFHPGNPWPRVVLQGASAEGDHDLVPLMGIQGSDKKYAFAQYEALREAIAVQRQAQSGLDGV
jgi:hypothetical protein